MMTFETLMALAAFAFVSSITPGPNNLMLMASGANFGFRRTIPHLLGVGIGFTVMIVAVGLGLVQLFKAVPIAHTILKIVSVLYLLYLAWKIATAAPPEPGIQGATPMTFLQAALFQWVNPKAWSMALTAIVAYAPPGSGHLGLITVALVFGAINLPCTGSWTLIGTQLRRVLTDPRRLQIFNLTMAALLIASAVPLIFAVAP
jgi:threonine/homoserine/homoserine lactone efflux protein